MNRRVLLSSTVSGLSIALAGCQSENGSENEQNCPEPDVAEADTLSYETYDFERLDDEWTGIYLFTEKNQLYEIPLIDEEVLGSQERQWIDETDFTQNAILAVQVVAPADSSELTVLGVTREEIIGEHDAYKLHAYTCINRPGEPADSELSAQLLRVAYIGETPDDAELTHWTGDSSFFSA